MRAAGSVRKTRQSVRNVRRRIEPYQGAAARPQDASSQDEVGRRAAHGRTAAFALTMVAPR